tara:strand:+ start:335 stop:1111 length:777 start_codon:yes stop_codon:yes gene_type:complete
MPNLEIIKEIRISTGAGIVDIKKALEESDNDIKKAIENLRKSGSKIAAKKSERSTNEGVISYFKDGNKIAIVGLSCETDFVSRNKDFIKAVNDYAKKLLIIGKENFKVFAEKNIKDELIVKIGENIQLNSFDIFEGNIIGVYIHSNNRLASVIILDGGNEELAKDIAMHVTAMAPKYLSYEDIPNKIIEKEKEIYNEQLIKEGKSKDIIKKIIDGKIIKFYTEVCLIKQNFVKDDKKTIEKLLEENNAVIKEYKYFSL